MTTAPEPRSAHPGVHDEHAWLWRRFHTLASLRAIAAAGGEWAPDLSEFNGAVDMGAVKQSGAAGVILRAGFGTVREDYRWRTNRANAEAVGLPWIAYWVCYPSYNSAGSEAAAFNAVVGKLPVGAGMAADCENDPGARPWPGGSVARDWLAAFLTATGPSDYPTLWYCSTSFVGAHEFGPLAGTWPWWEAAYGVAAPNELGMAPRLWQETDRATVPGVPGPCDVSVVLRGTFASLLYGSAPAPAPDPLVLLGGSSAMTIAIAARPIGPGAPSPPGVDTFAIAPDGASVTWSGDTPPWTPGTQAVLPPASDAPLRAVLATWVDDDALVVDVLDAAGARHRNVIRPSAGWKAGNWATVPGAALVTAVAADLVPGPKGDPGPPGPAYDDTAVKAEMAQHEHPLTGVAGPRG
jgi:GH25 family lysozyme M1 (1,4-beta-N-acetylmuramidase)